jgi:hypothetical protein
MLRLAKISVTFVKTNTAFLHAIWQGIREYPSPLEGSSQSSVSTVPLLRLQSLFVHLFAGGMR